MAKQSVEVIQSIIGAKIYENGKGKKGETAPSVPLVTVSRSLGAGGSETASLLAERLGVPLYDVELVNAITKAAKSDKEIVKRLDERISSALEDLLQSLVSSKGVGKEDFLHHMVKVLLGIARTGGVIVGRGANFILANEKAYRVRVEASFDVCLARVMEREDLKKKGKAKKLILSTNQEREDFANKVAKRYDSGRYPYDLIINSDTLTPAQVVDIIVSAMVTSGLPVKMPE